MSSPNDKADVQHVDTASLEEKRDVAAAENSHQALEQEKGLSTRQAWKVYRKGMAWSALVSCCIIMESYDTMLIGTFFAYPSFQVRFGDRLANGTYSIPAQWQTALNVSALVGIILGILMNGYLITHFGHRKVCLAALVLLTGFFALYFCATSREMLLAAQFLCGVPWGWLNTAAASYAIETAPTRLRHFATANVNLGWVVGHIIGAGILNGTVSITGDWGWKIPFALQWIFPLPLFIGIWFAPDSPWWLVRKGRMDDAIKALDRLSDGTVDNVALSRSMKHTIDLEAELKTGSSYAACFKGTNLRRTEIAVVVWSAQNFVGFAIQAFQIYFFTLAGLAAADSFKLGLGTYCIAFVGTTGSMYVMTYIGRRTLWLAGLCFMLPLMLLIGILGCLEQTSGIKWAQAILLLTWFFGYGFSAGPIPYVIATEVGSAWLREKTISLARSTYYVFLLVNSIVAPYMLNPTQADLKGKAAFPAAGFILIILVWSYFRLPETKGRPFEELDILFEKKIKARDFKTYEITAEDHNIDHLVSEKHTRA